MNRTCMLCIGLALAPPVWAAAPAAADPAASVPPVTYQSAFERYRGYREAPLADWRAVNEDVARIGGHAGVVRDHAPAKGTPAAPAEAHGGAAHRH